MDFLLIGIGNRGFWIVATPYEVLRRLKALGGRCVDELPACLECQHDTQNQQCDADQFPKQDWVVFKQRPGPGGHEGGVGFAQIRGQGRQRIGAFFRIKMNSLFECGVHPSRNVAAQSRCGDIAQFFYSPGTGDSPAIGQ